MCYLSHVLMLGRATTQWNFQKLWNLTPNEVILAIIETMTIVTMNAVPRTTVKRSAVNRRPLKRRAVTMMTVIRTRVMRAMMYRPITIYPSHGARSP